VGPPGLTLHPILKKGYLKYLYFFRDMPISKPFKKVQQVSSLISRDCCTSLDLGCGTEVKYRVMGDELKTVSKNFPCFTDLV
jgi:hypothetical protein